MANFGLKFPNFRYHGNRGRSDVNSNIHGSMCCIGRVMANLGLKFPNFRYHGNRGGLVYISATSLNCLTLKTPCLVQDS